MDIVYIETTVVGNIAGRIHPNPDVASRQRITREWWKTASSRYQIVTSQLTIDECSEGDPSAAKERLELLHSVHLLDESDASEALAELLIDRKEGASVGTSRRIAHCNCGRKRRTIHSDLELQTSSQSSPASSDCRNVSRGRIHSTGYLYPRATESD
jgi:hypothetical protein